MSTSHTRRRNLRLPEYNYAAVGTYFVTVCIQNRACVLGEISGQEVHLSSIGEMVETHLRLAMDRYFGIEIDAHVLMPNHLHALINIGWKAEADPIAVSENESRHGGLQIREMGASDEQTRRSATTGGGSEDPVSLFRVMQWFKSATTNEYIRRVKTDGWSRFPGKLWQPNYYEHVVRDQSDLDRIRAYILNNPGRWVEDTEYSLICRGFGS